MIISITQEDIDHAKGRTSSMNPLTWAILRQCGQSVVYHEGKLYPTLGKPVQVPVEIAGWCYRGMITGEYSPREVEINLPDDESNLTPDRYEKPVKPAKKPAKTLPCAGITKRTSRGG